MPQAPQVTGLQDLATFDKGCFCRCHGNVHLHGSAVRSRQRCAFASRGIKA